MKPIFKIILFGAIALAAYVFYPKVKTLIESGSSSSTDSTLVSDESVLSQDTSSVNQDHVVIDTSMIYMGLNDWSVGVYGNNESGSNENLLFHFDLPEEGEPEGEAKKYYLSMKLPDVPGTNMSGRKFEVRVDSDHCELSEMMEWTTVSLADLQFQKGSGTDAGAGQIYQTEMYVINYYGHCISFILTIHSSNMAAGALPPYDDEAEQVFLENIIKTIRIDNME